MKPFIAWGKFILTLVSVVITHGSYSAVITSKPVAGSISIGQFESPNLAAGQFEYTPADANWTFASSGISENSSGFTGANPNAPQGTQVAFIQGNGSISRTFSVANAGTFSFSFFIGQRSGNNQIVELSIDGKTISNFCPPGPAYSKMTSQGVPLSAGNHTIEFSGVNPYGGDNTAFIDDIKYFELRPWSSASSWTSGVVPNVGDDVNIDNTSAILLDQNVNVKSINAYGVLSVDLTKDISIAADYIMVMGIGSYFGWGDEGRPYEKKGVITLTGNNPAADVPGHGASSKGIIVMAGGMLKLQGNTKTSWTHLGANAESGSSSITLSDSPSNWQIGDEILIASSRINWNEAEKKTITAISGGGKTLTLNSPLAYPHIGRIKTYIRSTDNKTWTGDMRAEVGMLTKSIKIQGDESSEYNGFGGHIMVMSAGMAYVDGVELYRMGQKSILGRYPFHWHIVESFGKEQYIKNSSIHHSFNRAITIHGTESTIVDNNFCYDHIGHGLFLEDGVERYNQIRNNVVLLSKRPNKGEELIPSDNSDNEVQNRTPSSFWITNPNNIFENNVAGGTEGTGFWFALARNPVGPSAYVESFQGMEPYREPLGLFYGNKAHSCANGFDIFDQLNDDHSIAKNGGWIRTDERYLDATTFYGCGLAVYGGIGGGRDFVENVIFRDNIFLDNQEAIMHANYSTTLNSCFVANSGENVFVGTRKLNRGYDGSCTLTNCHLVGWQSENANYLGNTGGSIKHVNYRVSGLTKDFLGAPNMSLGDYSGFPQGDVGANDAEHPRFWSYVTWDKDGSLAGLPNSSIVTNHPLCLDGTEERFENWTNIYRSPHRFALFMLQYPGYDRPNVTIVRTKPGTPRVGMFYIHGFEDNPQLPFIVNEDFLYTLQFESLHPERYMHLTMMDDYVPGDNFMVCLKEFGKLGGIDVHGATYMNSINDVKNAGNSAFTIQNGDLYVRLVRTNAPDFSCTVVWSSDIGLAPLDTDGDGISDSQEAYNGTDPVGNDPINERPVLRNPEVISAWEFNTNGDSENWTLANSLSGLVSGGAQELTVTGADPKFKSPALNLSSYSFPYLRFRVKSNQAGFVEVFWSTANNPGFSGQKRTTFSVDNTNGEYIEVVLDMTEFSTWTGQITELRIDPEIGIDGNFAIDHISFQSENLLDCTNIWGGNAQIDHCGVCSGGVTGITPCIRWDFDSDDNSEGWITGDNVNGSVSNGCHSLSIYGGDPKWYSPKNLNVSASLYPYMRFVLSTNTSGQLEIFFGTNSSPGASGARLKTVQIPNTNGESQEFLINMSEHAEWKGTIYDLRIDPEFGTGNSVCIDLVAFEAEDLRDCNSDWDGGAYMDLCSVCVGGKTNQISDFGCDTAKSVNYWHFETDMESWGGLNQITATASNSIASLTINAADPFMHSPDKLGISATDYQYVAVRLQNQTAANTAELFWVTNNDPGFDGAKMVQFPVVANDTQQRTYIIDLSENPNWTGTIKQIRLDPTVASSGTVQLDYIKFVGALNANAIAVPGIVQAEDFNVGGQGNAYYDNDVANNGGQFRTAEAVDIESTGDASGTYNVGWTASGEWMEYLIDVAESGSYTIDVRAAAPGDGAQIQMFLDDEVVGNAININNTGGFQVYADNSFVAELASGMHLLRLSSLTGGYNINYISFTQNQPTTITPYTQINGGSWSGTNAAELCEGGSVSFGPHPVTESGWSWSGPNSFTSNSRQISLTDVQTTDQGEYTALFSNDFGIVSSETFSLSVLELPSALVSTTETAQGIDIGTMTFEFDDDPSWTNIAFSIDGGVNYTSVPDNSGSYTFTDLASGNYTVWSRWGNKECPVLLGNYTISESISTELPNPNSDTHWMVYPNPAVSGITVIFTEEIDNVQLEISNMLGQTVYQARINQPKHFVNTTKLPEGIYWLSIKNEIKRIIIQK